MEVAIYHDLPLTGGATTVLAEYLRRSPQHRFTIYTPGTAQAGLIDLDSLAHRVERHSHPGGLGPIGRYRRLWGLPRFGRRIAQEIDSGKHDVAFLCPSMLVQAPEALPFLRTPSLYYAPEPLRIAYERHPPGLPEPRSLKRALSGIGVNPYERKRRRLDRKHLRSAGHVMTHSRFMQSALQEIYGVHADVVPLGVDAQRYSPAQVIREGFVLSIGALHPYKGHQFVIEALSTIDRPPPLVLLGDRGEYGERLRDLAAHRGLTLEIRYAVPFDEAISLYRRAGVLACGAYREPFGLTPLEAMSTQTPVVAVNEGGFTETITHGVTGLLTSRDPEDFGRAVQSILASSELGLRLGAAGREDVLRRWTWEETAAGIDSLLQGVATPSSRVPRG